MCQRNTKNSLSCVDKQQTVELFCYFDIHFIRYYGLWMLCLSLRIKIKRNRTKPNGMTVTIWYQVCNVQQYRRFLSFISFALFYHIYQWTMNGAHQECECVIYSSIHKNWTGCWFHNGNRTDQPRNETFVSQYTWNTNGSLFLSFIQ